MGLEALCFLLFRLYVRACVHACHVVQFLFLFFLYTLVAARVFGGRASNMFKEVRVSQ